MTHVISDRPPRATCYSAAPDSAIVRIRSHCSNQKLVTVDVGRINGYERLRCEDGSISRRAAVGEDPKRELLLCSSRSDQVAPVSAFSSRRS
ncbi:hypothetical protein BHE74_00047331 [Ensete ventricosum]|uniref:Uncharacterized protein n=1 Tax=Ensete ventricosum TaxID=4639 RepID=A0A426YNQ0_ENSVE|nr:hypothetical protein B296_00046302 [Ensete ventricosum]RWW46722.1 hypothetical protein BHE74_00047331 [Ensete ventricosum]